MVRLNLTWKQKKKKKLAHPCAAVNEKSTNGPTNKAHMRGRSRQPPEAKCMQEMLLRWRPEQIPGTQVRAKPSNQGNGHLFCLSLSLCFLLSVFSRFAGFWLIAVILEGIPPKKFEWFRQG